jgi:simple sugar transport system permease protein
MNVLYFLVQQTMFFSIPLLIVALGGMYSERGGVINIALEGIMIFGAFTGGVCVNGLRNAGTAMNGQVLLLLAVLVSGAIGAIASLTHAYAAINLKADQVISGTALNMLAPALAIFVGRRISERGTQQVHFEDWFRFESVPVLGDIPVIGDLLFKNSYLTTYIGFAILLASWAVLNKTRFGLRLRSCGEHPQAADSVGINVYKMRYLGVMISGFLGGVGGLVFVIPTSREFNATVSGYGFLALAVLIFGQWRPLRILGAAFFFGLLKAISASSSGLPLLKDLSVSAYFYKMMPFVVTLVVLAFTSKNSQAPKAEGIPYDKGVR